MTLMLTPDDIQTGAYVTVLQPRHFQLRPRRPSLRDILDSVSDSHDADASPDDHNDTPSGDRRRGPIIRTDKIPVPAGVPMQVIAVSLPFVACSVIQPGGAPPKGPAIIDVRRTQLAKVDTLYVAALHAFNCPPEDDGDDAGEGAGEGACEGANEGATKGAGEGACENGANADATTDRAAREALDELLAGVTITPDNQPTHCSTWRQLARRVRRWFPHRDRPRTEASGATTTTGRSGAAGRGAAGHVITPDDIEEIIMRKLAEMIDA